MTETKSPVPSVELAVCKMTVDAVTYLPVQIRVQVKTRTSVVPIAPRQPKIAFVIAHPPPANHPAPLRGLATKVLYACIRVSFPSFIQQHDSITTC